MYEVELKAILRNKNETINAIKRLKSSKIETLVYEDFYFDTPQKKLFNAEIELRVRKKIGNDTHIILTYKDVPFDINTKSKPEYEVEVSDATKIISILISLGYIIDISFSKFCSNYYLNFNKQKVTLTIVDLKETKTSFIELETVIENKNDINFAINNLYLLLEELKISRKDLTNEYYTDLIRNLSKKK